MKKSFACSLICRGGILGGEIYIDEESITYKTNKLTVDKKYKSLALPLNEICELTWKWIVFPIATIRMTSGDKYKFIIFNKSGFNKRFTELKS